MSRKRRQRTATKTSASDGADSLERIFRAAVEDHQAGRLKQAEKKLNRIQKIQPDIAEVLHLFGVVLLKTGRPAAAADALAKAVEALPHSVDVFNLLGIALCEDDKPGEALRVLEKAVDHNPGSAKAHYNLGNSYRDLGRPDEAATGFQNAVALAPDFADAHYNLGLMLGEAGRFEAAAEAYRRVMAINPKDAVALNNLANALGQLGDPEGAVEALRAVVEIDPKFVEAAFNLGNILRELRRFGEAESVFRRVLETNPDLARAHANLGTLLGEMGKASESIEHIRAAIRIDPGDEKSYGFLGYAIKAFAPTPNGNGAPGGAGSGDTRAPTADTPEPWLLNYWLDSFTIKPTVQSFRQVIAKLPAVESAVVQLKPSAGKTPRPEGGDKTPGRIVALIQFGRSGTGFLHSLFDGHPEVATLPGIYMQGFFGRSVWEQIKAREPQEMVQRFINLYDILFDATSTRKVPGFRAEGERHLGLKEGYTTMGEDKSTVLRLDREEFGKRLTALLDQRHGVHHGDFFKLVHTAFEQTLGRNAGQNLIFYHIHAPNLYTHCNYLKYFPKSKLIMTVREPLQSLESWLSLGWDTKYPYNYCVSKIIGFLFGFDRIEYTIHPFAGVRLEDLVENPSATLDALCGWLGIATDDALDTSTMQGLRWWGALGGGKRLTRFDTASGGEGKPLERRVGYLFDERDQLILGTLLHPLSVAFGYKAERSGEFERNLKAIRPMIEEPFGFEDVLAERQFGDALDYKAGVHCKVLRSALLDRWAVLNKFKTYPNMISPLRISG